jgi:RNA-binding protein
MPAIALSTSERNTRRAEAHHLDPVVTIGSDGLSAAVTKEIDQALAARGLIKVRVLSDDREFRDKLLAKLVDELNAAAIQHIGKLLVLWRPVRTTEAAPDRQPTPRVVKLVKFSKSGNHRPQVRKIKLLGNQRITAGGEIRRTKKRHSVSLKKGSQQA